MIKVYCDKCGKEITDNVNVVVEDTEIVDCHDTVIMKLRSGVSHICNECQYNDLTCGFKVGDQVITDSGRVGVIESICNCDRCKKRGFYEPRVKMKIGTDQIWITDADKKNGFISFYKIGDKVFGNVDEESTKHLRQRIVELQHELIEVEAQLNMAKKLTYDKNN